MRRRPAPSAGARFMARALLALYPTAVRERFGRDMTADFLESYAERQSFPGRMSFLIAATIDAMRSAIAEHREARSDVLAGDLQPARRATMYGFTEDVRFGLRALRRRPGFVATVVTTLALGIGANSAVFSMIDAIFLRPIAVDHAGSLVAVYQAASAKFPIGPNLYPAYRGFRDASHTLAAVAGSASHATTVTGPSGVELLASTVVSGNYFDVLGIKPFIGRLIVDADDGVHGASPVIVLSHHLWQRWYGDNQDVVGKTVKIADRIYTIVGVAPESFRGTTLATVPDLWAPMSMLTSMGYGMFFGPEMDAEVFRTHEMRWVSVVGRVRSGTTVSAVEKELNQIMEHIPYLLSGQQSYEHPITVVPITQAAAMNDRPTLVRFVRLMFGVVALTLLLACANVANLLLVRSSERAQELGVRTALGAGRARIVRQLFIESALLALSGAAAGLVVALATMRALSAFTLPGDIPLAQLDLSIDARVLAFTATVAVGTSLLFGLLPAIRASRLDLAAFLRNDRGSASGTALRNALVGTQVALALTLLIGATLFARSLRAGLTTDLGFDPHPLAAVSFDLKMSGYDPARTRQFYDAAEARLRLRPEIRHVAVALHIPLASTAGLQFSAPDATTPEGAKGVKMFMNSIGDDYFATIGVPITAGRSFTPTESSGSEHVAIVNEAAAHQLWGNANPIGRSVKTMMLGKPFTVVGVVKTTKYTSMTDDDAGAIFFPLRQPPSFGEMSVVARGASPTNALRAIQQELTALDPTVSLRKLRLVGQQIDEVLMPQRFGMRLFAIFSLIALVIASVGVHGVVAYGVTLRRRELGIRIALGARSAHIYWTVLRGSLIAVAVGAVIGLGVGAASSPALAAFLYGVRPLDGAAFAGATLALVIAAVAATILPARRASRTDPVSSMRAE